jgi:multidrug efflux pump subunit AcrA (membrane-fusion protein)
MQTVADEFVPASLALVQTPRAARTLARVFLALLASSAVCAAVLPWQQTATGAGRVVAYAPTERQQVIDAPIEGRAVRYHVREGAHVRAGDPLVDIADNDPDIVGRLRQERAALVARLAAARARAESVGSRVDQLSRSRQNATEAAERRLQMARERARAATQGLAAAEAAAATAQLNIDRQRALGVGGLASTRTVELAELDQVRARTDADRARASLAAARAEELAFQSDLLRAGTDGAAAVDDARASRAAALAEVGSSEAELARLEVRLARQSTQRVTAPRDGTVLRVYGGTGADLLKPGDPLMVFVPDTDARAVELWVDGNEVPLLREGRRVRVQFEGWPAIQFSGWPSVAVGTFGGTVAVIDSADDGRGKFRVLVLPDPGERWPSGRYLRQGVRANGWILLNRVSIAYELWRQFNGFPPTVSRNEPGAASAPYGGGR